MPRTDAEFPFTDYFLYKVWHKKEGRFMANLVLKSNWNKRTTLSFARYIMSIKEKRFLTENEEVDHKNGDKSDDSIDNLQILTPQQNKDKYIDENDLRTKPIPLVCPICNKQFFGQPRLVNRTIRRGRKPCCSRRCGGIYSHQ